MPDQTEITSNPLPKPTQGSDVGCRIGDFILTRILGEGGFGVVYEAEQTEPIKRQVAIKLMRSGCATAEFIARFDIERQALALMDHPHIASVLDAGTTDDGRPYFVMERVQGQPITDYCNQHQLSVDQRLQLFAQICDAMQHAHGKGVIHRDIKPNNVLVGTQDGQAFAKVIDFGIAKAADATHSDTALTQQHVLVGTPAYMSPEQASGSGDIDTRSDIYALGVLLYQLLTGATPFDAATLRDVGYLEMQRMIREVEPPSPSQRLVQMGLAIHQAAIHCHTDPRRLRARVRGELDWVVMKALEKDRDRRYQTASELGQDIRRLLSGRPVTAAPPSRWYRTGKFVRRHTGWVAAAAVLLFSLAAGVVSFAWQARIAQHRVDQLDSLLEFQQATFDKIDATSVGRLLSENVNRQLRRQLANSELSEGEREAELQRFTGLWHRINAADAARRLIDAAILKPALDQLDKSSADPEVDAALRQMLADRYEALGLYRKALPLQQAALKTRLELLGESDPDTLASSYGMAVLHWDQMQLDEARKLLERVVELGEIRLGPEHRQVLEARATLASVLITIGDNETSDQVLKENLQRIRRALSEDDQLLRDTLHDLAVLASNRGEFEQAEQAFRDLIEQESRMLGADSREVLISRHNLATALISMGRADEGERELLDCLRISELSLGEDDAETVEILFALADAQWGQDKLAAAEKTYRRLHESLSQRLGLDHRDSLASMHYLGEVLLEREKLHEAHMLLRQAWLGRQRVLGPNDQETLNSLIMLVSALNLRQEFEVAAQLMESNRAGMEATLGKADPELLALGLSSWADSWRGLGQAVKADPLLDQAQALLAARDEATPWIEQAYLRSREAQYSARLGQHDSSADRQALEAVRARLRVLEQEQAE